MILPPKTQKLITDWPLGFVATITPDGRPAVSPKGTFVVLGESQIAFANIRSPGTIANLKNCPDCEVNFLDVFLRKGVRVRGSAEIISPNSKGYDTLFEKFKTLWPTLYERIAEIVVINIKAVLPLVTPPYDDGASEEDMITLYKQKFAELYP